MARYLLVQVDDNHRAEKLRAKLDGVEGIKTVGVFGKPTQFCECDPRTDDSEKGAKMGWWLCRQCRKPKRGQMQNPYNLLEDGTPSQFWNALLAIREPYQTAVERVGQDTIDRLRAQMSDAATKLERARRRRARGAKIDRQRGM